MTAAELPEEGELRLGPVALPPGRRIVPDGHEPVAWVTSRAVPDPGRAWAELRDLHSGTRLVPILLPDDAVAESEGFYFCDPVGADAIDQVDAAGVLTALWDDAHQDMSKPVHLFDAPLTRDFLGLKTAAEGGNSLADIAEAIIGAVTDPRRRGELEPFNQQDRENAGWPPPPARHGDGAGATAIPRPRASWMGQAHCRRTRRSPRLPGAGAYRPGARRARGRRPGADRLVHVRPVPGPAQRRVDRLGAPLVGGSVQCQAAERRPGRGDPASRRATAPHPRDR